MSPRRLHALGSCLVSAVYPLLGVLCRDAVAPIMLFGSLFLGVYRYLLGYALFSEEAMPDRLSFLFSSRRGRKSPTAFALAVLAAGVFAVLMLLPARILLDVSVDLAKIAFFVPTVYCAVTALLLFRTEK